jgi:hypothetical protein
MTAGARVRAVTDVAPTSHSVPRTTAARAGGDAQIPCRMAIEDARTADEENRIR